MGKAETKEEPLKQMGGRLCLAFANTASWHNSAHPEERLRSYFSLVKWSQITGILSDAEAQALQSSAVDHPDAAQKTLEKAIQLREALFRIFSVVIIGAEPQAADVSLLSSLLSEVMAKTQLRYTAQGFSWLVPFEPAQLDGVLYPVIRSAADLLVSQEIRQVKKCSDVLCGWLFLDESRNRSRKWCDMQDCGNRNKARRFYGRKKKGRESA